MSQQLRQIPQPGSHQPTIPASQFYRATIATVVSVTVVIVIAFAFGNRPSVPSSAKNPDTSIAIQPLIEQIQTTAKNTLDQLEQDDYLANFDPSNDSLPVGPSKNPYFPDTPQHVYPLTVMRVLPNPYRISFNTLPPTVVRQQNHELKAKTYTPKPQIPAPPVLDVASAKTFSDVLAEISEYNEALREHQQEITRVQRQAQEEVQRRIQEKKQRDLHKTKEILRDSLDQAAALTKLLDRAGKDIQSTFEFVQSIQNSDRGKCFSGDRRRVERYFEIHERLKSTFAID